MKRLRIPHSVADLIRALHPHVKRKVRNSLEVILSEPYAGKPLKEKLEGLRSFRMGRLRIVYRVEGREIQIIAIGPRRRVYEETARAIRKEPRDSK